MKHFLRLVVVGLVVVALWFGLRALRQGRVTEPTPPTESVEIVLARERAVAHFERGEWQAARAELAPLIVADDAALEDLVRAAIVDYADRASRDPEALFARIREIDPDNPELHFMQARLALERAEFEVAREHFETVRHSRPDDLATAMGLATTLSELGRPDEARKLLDEVIEHGLEHANAWYVQAIYRLSQIAVGAGDDDRARELQDLYEQLHRLGFRTPSARQNDEGELAKLHPTRSRGVIDVQSPRAPEFSAEPTILPEFAGARELFVHDLDNDGDADFLAAGPQGLFAALRNDGGYSVEPILTGSVGWVRAFDLGNRDRLDLLVGRDDEVVLYEQRSGSEVLLGDPNASRWNRSPLALPPVPSAPVDALLVDFDHDGDLDLLVVGAFGARLHRNDGAAPRTDGSGIVTRGAFVDVTLEAGLPTQVELSWCATEDFDNDHDVDLLLGAATTVMLMDNHRAGKFEDVAVRVFGRKMGFPRKPTVADLDADGRPDLFAPGRPSSFWRQGDDGVFGEVATTHHVPESAAVRAIDLDLDGVGDLVWASASGALDVVLAFGTSVAMSATIGGVAHASAPLCCADFDRDLDNDFARITDAGLEIFRCVGPVGHAARLEPLGLKDNRRAVGAVIEARTRGMYRRVYWRGEPELFGCGAFPQLDVVRTIWPNGAIQTMLDVAPKDRPFVDTSAGGLVQSQDLIGSCPFLYAWNGETFGFITDVLGGTPLGLPIAPGMLVPPDHDEYVQLGASQLVERDGRLVLQITEELREVTYLDRARLDVIDHPASSEIHPNERFSFPPFPEPVVHSASEVLAPLRVLGSDGRDWTRALAEVDDQHAAPFDVLEPQFMGLATPHWLEFEFDAPRVRDASRLRLLCTGWFFWTDASVNMASARTPGVSFVPPTLQLQNQAGQWVDAGPPLGFPAGKSKTMVIELGPLMERNHAKMRLFSTLRLYWDSIRLAVDEGDAPIRTTPLEPASARLWARGFSRGIETSRRDLPQRFDWDALDPQPRWNQHPGRYTRYGETVELLGAVDDRFVILGSGDALTLEFDARELPMLPEGWIREYQLFLDGWAKDRDPNTVEALEVEPLPFHGMSGYPYGEGESFPDTPEHRAWRTEWNTRAARRWIAPLAPNATDVWSREIALGAVRAK